MEDGSFHCSIIFPISLPLPLLAHEVLALKLLSLPTQSHLITSASDGTWKFKLKANLMCLQ